MRLPLLPARIVVAPSRRRQNAAKSCNPTSSRDAAVIASTSRVRGQAVTPAVLALVHELSAGRSAEVNRRLIEDNAGLAAEVAVAYADLGE